MLYSCFGGPRGQVCSIQAWNAVTRTLSVETPINIGLLGIGTPIAISRWGEYIGQLKTKAIQPGKPPALADQTIEVEAGQQIVFSLNDDAPYATITAEVLVAEASDLEVVFAAVDARAAVVVRMRDSDANRNSHVSDTIQASVSSSRGDGESEELLLVESGPATGIFAGVLPLVFSRESGISNDGHLRGLTGDPLIISYTDLAPAATYKTTRALAFAATIHMPRPVFAADRPIQVTVIDPDLNLDRSAPDMVRGLAFLKVFPSGDSEAVTLTESAESSNIFTGEVEAQLLAPACCAPLWLHAASAPPVLGNGVLEIALLGNLTFEYQERHPAGVRVLFSTAQDLGNVRVAFSPGA